eukprot:TRINITY_DN26182_c0_g1_i1.p1 TRINITY_DN26182_c0_g1~~TRINITY_DN26182_c0_g1_i1.p1  ORF type:complete len:531 (+),score=75.47 TRINITY_DN26182_c0_g1_i1:97-1689(+)
MLNMSHAASHGAGPLDEDIPAIAMSVSLFSMVLSVCIVVTLAFCLGSQCRKGRQSQPMPWDIFRRIGYGDLAMVQPDRHPLDSQDLEVTVVDLADIARMLGATCAARSAEADGLQRARTRSCEQITDAVSEATATASTQSSSGGCPSAAVSDAGLPLIELLEWIKQHPFTGYKGGIARLVAKLLWLERGNSVLESEIGGFNDIDLIYFLREGEEDKQTAMKTAVDDGLVIGGIPVEAVDVEYSYDTIPNFMDSRDVTQNQILLVSDEDGRVLLVNTKVCHEHCLRATTAPVPSAQNVLLDDQGNMVEEPKVVGRAFMQWLKGRAHSIELLDATHRFYNRQKLPMVTVYQILSKCKGDEKYMRAYTELVRLGLLERQQYPHMLWGECYRHMNSLIARHGYRLELESELDSKAVEVWKEQKYATAHMQSRLSLYRDYRWHRVIIDKCYTMAYSLENSADAQGLSAHACGVGSGSTHKTRDSLTFLREQAARDGMDSILQMADGRVNSSRTGEVQGVTPYSATPCESCRKNTE